MELLDAKHNFVFNDVFDHIKVDPQARKVANGVWIIDNFLNSDECQHLIQTTEKIGYESINHQYTPEQRDSQRLIGFDANGHLIQTITDRLKMDYLPERLSTPSNQRWPYGVSDVDWQPLTQSLKINPCLRFHHYQQGSVGFEWHRDSQVTLGHYHRSNYTMLIYLGDSLDNDGQIEFQLPKTSYVNLGLTITDELQQLAQLDTPTLIINPQKGQVILFDQRLIHRAYPLTHTEHKYVLRTDLMVTGHQNQIQLTETQLEIQNLTRQLFRQAQFYELSNDKRAGDLYSICLALRQTPEKIDNCDLVKHLDTYLEPMTDSILMTPHLRFDSRNGRSYQFQLQNISILDTTNILDSIKVAGLITSVTSTMEMVTDFSTKVEEYQLQLHNDYVKRKLAHEKYRSQLAWRTSSPNPQIQNHINLNVKMSTYVSQYINQMCVDNQLETTYDLSEDEDELSDQSEDEVEDDIPDQLSRIEFQNIRECRYEHLREILLSPFQIGSLQPLSSVNQAGVILSSTLQPYNAIDCECSLGDTWDRTPRQETLLSTNLELTYNSKINEIQLDLKSLSTECWTGTLRLLTPTQTFNHASCQCDGWVNYDNNKGSTPVGELVVMDLTFEYMVSTQQIIINYVPRVII